MSELVSLFIGFEQEKAEEIVEALAKISVGDRLKNSLPWDGKYENEVGVISGFAGIEKQGN